MTMIKRVAGAIIASANRRDSDEDMARAAIAAMREPTPQMLKASGGWLDTPEIWQAMIDAALEGTDA